MNEGYVTDYGYQENYINEMGYPANQQTHPRREAYQGGESFSIMLVAPGDYIISKDPKGPPAEKFSPLGMPLGQEERVGWQVSLYLHIPLIAN